MKTALDNSICGTDSTTPVFAEECLSANTLHRSNFGIGRVSVQIVASQERDVALGSSLEPFRTTPCVPDVFIQVHRVHRVAAESGRQLFDSGCTWRLFESEAGFQFDFYVPSWGERPYKRLLIDRQFREATLQMNEESLAGRANTSVSPMTYPLDELLIAHRLTQEKAIELHGCGLVRADGIGNLFVGHSGAGKSTTTRLWTTCEEVEVLSDDRIIVRPDDESLADAPQRRGRKTRMRMYGTPWHGEEAYASPASAPLERIFILEHGHGNALTRLSPSQAVAELFARSFVPFHRHEYVDSALEFLQELTDAIPVYRYAFEPDQRAVDAIRTFYD